MAEPAILILRLNRSAIRAIIQGFLNDWSCAMWRDNDDLVDAFLWITGENFEPDELSAHIGLSPTKTFKTQKFCQWILSSKDSVPSGSIQQHARWLLDKITPKSQQIGLLPGKGYQAEFRCRIFARADQTAVILDPETLQEIGKLGLMFICEIDFAQVSMKSRQSTES